MKTPTHEQVQLVFSTSRDSVAPSDRIAGRFLRGPIPMAWLDVARALPGRAIHVAIEIWHWRFIKKSMTVKINLSRMGRFGVTRPTASRGLQALESAGLVRVEREPGRAPVVTIIDIKPKAGTADHADI